LRKLIISRDNVLAWIVGLGVFLPVFFTLGGGLYKSEATLQDSGGVIMTLPLPMSLLICGMGILYLLPRMREAKVALWVIFSMLSVISISLLIASEQGVEPDRKLIASVQILLPFFGLLLGQLIRDSGNSLAKSFLLVLTLVVPIQLAGSMLSLIHI
jgi:hypothetical protein